MGETGERFRALIGLVGVEAERGFLGSTYERRNRSYASFLVKVMGLNGMSSSLSSGERGDESGESPS